MKVEDDVSPELPLLVCGEGDITTTVLAKLVVRIRKCFKDIASHYAEVKCFDILLLVVSIPSGVEVGSILDCVLHFHILLLPCSCEISMCCSCDVFDVMI